LLSYRVNDTVYGIFHYAGFIMDAFLASMALPGIREGKGFGKVSARAYVEYGIPAFACCDRAKVLSQNVRQLMFEHTTSGKQRQRSATELL